jgi:hypothetical protein
MPKAKAVSNFQPKHEVEYGLKISARHPISGKVSSVVCRFCTTFGREKNVGGKRARTKNVKYFTTFRADGYKRHLYTAHSVQWEEYQQILTNEDKENFFKKVPLVAVGHNTVDAVHMEEEQANHIRVLINGPIVETVIGGLLFHPDNVENVTRECALQLFKKLDDPDPENGEEGQRDLYEVVIKTPRTFHLCINFVACGASSRIAARLMDCTQAESGLGIMYGGCTATVASNYTRFVCAYCLQVLSDVLRQVWAFSITLDESIHQGKSYLDIRVRFHVRGKLFNFHLMAIPLLCERHTSQNMFDVLVRFMDAVVPSWRTRCIAVSTDGVRSMTGRSQGVATRIQQVCAPGLLRIWCGLPQLDLVTQRVCKPALEGDFYKTLTALIGHLRRQVNLISDMKSTCPKVSDVRWISMDSVWTWLVNNRARVLRHLDTKKPSCTPNIIWWIFLHAMQSLCRESKATFVSLQGLSTIISEQHSRLNQLIDTYCRMVGMQGPLSPEQIGDIVALQPAETSGAFIVTHKNVRAALDGLGLWMMEQIDGLDDDDLSSLLGSVGKIFVAAADGISQLVGDRDESNETTTDELPPVLPCELCRIDMRQFVKLLQSHRQRLLPFFGADGIEDISKEFAEFLRAFRDERLFKEAVMKSCGNSVSFLEGWSPTNDRFPMLQKFCGGLASAFPITATAKLDFSIMGWEKNNNRMDLTDFSLEGILHSKQFQHIQLLSDDLSTL